MTTGPSTPRQRVIRVFVSSTFRDMHAEREELVKRVFPQLRKLCEARGVTWGEVDLRWGVTEEEKAEGKVLPICLAEIQRCRPYFIGLLGQRYGWLPGEIPQELIDQQPWLGEHRTRSVTELEILHGVLNNPEMAGHAFFYFRDPACADGLPPEEEANAEKLRTLKDRIRLSGLPVREDYPNPTVLGELVYEDLRGVIESQFPPEPLDPLDRDGADHEAFAQSRARVYISRQKCLDRLEAHATGEGEPLVVLGESGVGKSALLANWALGYQARHPEQLVLMHFVGASPYSADWAAMLRRILGEFRRRLGVEVEIPDKPDALRLTFANALHMAAARGQVVLVLDALNQLEDRDGAPDLVWLPPVIPANVRLVVSTLPGRPLEDLKKRGWPVLEVEPLTAAERRQLIREYLAQYTKTLSEHRAEKIASAEQASNPLYLRALLEELRLFGVHERLDERVAHYLSARSIPELYERILERWEQDYERERPQLVRDAMSLIWAARRGLSEAELLELLGTDGQPLPHAHWSPLYLAAEQALVSRSGFIGFFHDYLRQAVQNRYLAAEPDQQAAHLRLAGYFEAQELGPRKVDEQPWQLTQAQAWERLAQLLAAPDFFGAAWGQDEYAVRSYWARLETMSEWRMTRVYGALLAAPESAADKDHLWRVATLLADGGHPEDAYTLRAHLAEHYRQEGDPQKLQEAIGNQALILQVWGRLGEAMALLKEQEHQCRELGDKHGLRVSLGCQALILRAWGRLEEAMALNKEEERLCRELGNKHGLLVSLGCQARILWAWGRLEEAMALHKEEERLCRELGKKDELGGSLGSQAVILRDRGGREEAMALHKEEERLCRELGSKYGLLRSLGNQAVILQAWGRREEAMALHKEEELLCRELRCPEGLAISLANQAVLLHEGMNCPHEALPLAEEAYRLAADHGLAVAQQIKPILDQVRAKTETQEQ